MWIFRHKFVFWTTLISDRLWSLFTILCPVFSSETIYKVRKCMTSCFKNCSDFESHIVYSILKDNIYTNAGLLCGMLCGLQFAFLLKWSATWKSLRSTALNICEYLSALSLPEVRWQFTKPIEVPLKRRETPTAPLFPVTTETKQIIPIIFNNHLVFLGYKIQRRWEKTGKES